MTTVTTKDKANFFEATAVISSALDSAMISSYDTILEAAKKINVSSTYLIANIMGDICNTVNKNARELNSSAVELLTVYKKNEYNVGEYKDAVNHAISVCEANEPSAKNIESVSVNATGEEDMSPATVGELSSAIDKMAKMARESLLDLSSKASGMKDEPSVAQIGKKIEVMTNAIIVGSSNINKEIKEMAVAYGIELRQIEDYSSAIKLETEEISKKKTIKFDTEI